MRTDHSVGISAAAGQPAPSTSHVIYGCSKSSLQAIFFAPKILLNT